MCYKGNCNILRIPRNTAYKSEIFAKHSYCNVALWCIMYAAQHTFTTKPIISETTDIKLLY